MKCIILILALLRAPLLSNFWLVEQEYIKIDKQEIYETIRKGASKESEFCFYDAQDRAYVYLRPSTGEARQPSKPPSLLNSILNFTVSTLQELQPDLSSRFTGHLEETPYAAYQIFSVLPVAEKVFCEQLHKVAIEYEKSSFCWGVWKIIYGSELPKYVIGFFAPDAKSLETELKTVKLGISKEWYRRSEEGRAVLMSHLKKD